MKVINSTQLQQDQQFIDDLFSNWLVGHDLPTECLTEDPVVSSVFQNIVMRMTWETMGDHAFEWKDYVLIQLNNGTFHPMVVIKFIDWLFDGDFKTMVSDLIKVNQQSIAVSKEFIDWAPNLCGHNVRRVEQRIADQAKRHETESTGEYLKQWTRLLKRLSRRLASLKTTEVKAAESAIKSLISDCYQENDRNKNINIDFDKQLSQWLEMNKRYREVKIPPIPIIESANVYEGQVTITLKSEAIQKWASALCWFSDREELHNSLHQVLLETGEMLKKHEPFTEGQEGALCIERNGFKLGVITHKLICKTCGKSGGGNCPDCGPCS